MKHQDTATNVQKTLNFDSQPQKSNQKVDQAMLCKLIQSQFSSMIPSLTKQYEQTYGAVNKTSLSELDQQVEKDRIDIFHKAEDLANQLKIVNDVCH